MDTSHMNQSPSIKELRIPWLIVGTGLLGLYIPTYWNLAHTLWLSDEQFHGPIIAMIVAYLCVTRRNELIALTPEPSNASGALTLSIGLLIYVVGRSQDIIMFEVGSQIPVFAGTMLLMQGKSSLRILWFPLFYLVFMIPLPGVMIDSLTGPLKQWVSVIVEETLYDIGYPIARSGVTITIGQYQLLVADACSGLHSMFTLMATGLLFIYLIARKNWLYNIIMLSSILPIAFLANIIRVMALILITYHFGDDAGQGFLHGFAGMILLVVAVLSLFMLDALLTRWLGTKKNN
jgi:exosortase B